ncbi:hypothetical protein MBENS4_4055 [Novosphingobium sp. MBES04]|nr:hypothetical protein MBENS4_4055 [Novosphingobium sp. MBES04]
MVRADHFVAALHGLADGPEGEARTGGTPPAYPSHLLITARTWAGLH